MIYPIPHFHTTKKGIWHYIPMMVDQMHSNPLWNSMWRWLLSQKLYFFRIYCEIVHQLGTIRVPWNTVNSGIRGIIYDDNIYRPFSVSVKNRAFTNIGIFPIYDTMYIYIHVHNIPIFYSCDQRDVDHLPSLLGSRPVCRMSGSWRWTKCAVSQRCELRSATLWGEVVFWKTSNII